MINTMASVEDVKKMQSLYKQKGKQMTNITYKIIRYQFYGEPEVIKQGLTIEEAKEHCNDPSTEGIDWFDGFTKEEI
tara:strand:- start:234 stop:464 length:231 start_codon:yes stop_codon:yes gene_type:complete